MTKPPLRKMAPKRKYECNEDSRKDFAWIAVAGQWHGAVQSVCHFSTSGGRTDVRRHQESARHVKLAKRRALRRVG